MKINLNYIGLLFVYLYINIFGGVLVTFGLLPRSTFFLLLSPILLIFLNGLKIQLGVLFYFIAIFTYLILNKFINGSNLNSLFGYLAFAIFPILIYHLVKLNNKYINGKSFKQLLIITLILQIPFLLIQIIFYDNLYGAAVEYIIREDFTVGTFWTRNDPALNFFLLMLLNTILYNRKYMFKKKESILYIITCIVGIGMSNSTMGLFCLIGSFGAYAISFENIKNNKSKYLITIIIIGVIVLVFNTAIVNEINILISRMTNVTDGAIQNFQSGNYARAAAIMYFFDNPIKIIGDGMGKYLNMSTMEYKLGLQGQSLLMYAEVGLIGIILYFSFVFQLGKLLCGKLNKIHIVSIGILFLYTLTARPFTDISILMSFFIFLSLNNDNQKVAE